MKVKNLSSKNFDRKERRSNKIKFLVIHYTGMQSERESIKRLCSPRSKVSSHFLINRQGKIYRLVDDNKVAWHAGKSRWGKYKNLNKNSIGIELVNNGHQFGYTNFSKKQILNLIKVCKKLVKKYRIRKENVVGHSDIAPTRKVDPGEKFPWTILAKKNIGIWHNCKINFLKKLRKTKISQKEKVKFIKNIKNIGYRFSVSNNFFLVKTVKAFQRRFRKELINGQIDKECLVISENLLKKL